MSEMTPREIVSELDKHIIGQDNAKRSVAIALRNRWRRMQLNEELLKTTGDRPNSSRNRPLLVRHSAKNCVKASLMTKKSRSILPQHRWALKLWLLQAWKR